LKGEEYWANVPTRRTEKEKKTPTHKENKIEKMG